MKHFKLKHLIFIAIAAIIASCSSNNNDEDTTATKPIVPKKELRGVWMATVWGLDWPMGNYDSQSQQELYKSYLDLFAANNINAVFVQIRGMADAFYDSQYEPWSKNITGDATQKPDYDVLKFLIDEAHKRGIQFHAWINPYRIATRTDKNASFPALDPKIPKEWVKDYNKIRIYNPAMPEVQSRITDIVKEIISKYDVDGIHMDDYFYPALDGDEKINDDAEYATYGNGKYSSVEDFRRDNVNKVIQDIQKAIVDTKPKVVFSISPAADNDNNYNNLYADVVKWSQEGWVDVIIPQLYFATGSAASSFNQRLYWWSQFTYKNALMVGYGLYKFGDPTAGDKFQTSDDLKSQFDYAASKPKVQGSILYSAKSLLDNKVNIMDVIKKVYSRPALPPFLGRTTVAAPSIPADVKISGSNISWDTVNGSRYAVYKSNGAGQTAYLVAITSSTTYSLSEKGTYFVTAVNADNVESDISTLVTY
ncbi:MAG: family 10 glycosylhydrolase [Bacteroidales bacterium]|nr:family 10 glycosylhydrolase [Bacteroidales bacterium]